MEISVPSEERKQVTPSNEEPDNHKLEKEAITPVWCFGFNQKVPIINLSKNTENVVLYASAHLLVLSEVENNKQQILRGHCNDISCLTCSADKRWLASGDAGSNSAVIIWDGNTGEIVRIMLEPHPNGVIAISLTHDARYLATLSADSADQQFSIWNWTSGSENPMCTITLDDTGFLQTQISFKYGDYFQVITNGPKNIIFHSWDTSGKIETQSLTVKDEDFGKRVGIFVGSHYVPDSSAAITATTQGHAVLWQRSEEMNLQNSDTDTRKQKSILCTMEAVKLVPLHEHEITMIAITECLNIKYCIVTGDITGVLKFFDTKFMLVFWFQNINAGPIAAISFSNRGVVRNAASVGWKSSIFLETTQYPKCSTIPGERFVTEDFIVTTGHSNMLLVILNGGIIKFIKRDNHELVTALASHPTMPLVTTCCITGRLITFNYESKTVILMKDYDNHIQSCKYNENGLNLAIGFTDGKLDIVDSMTLQSIIKEPFDCGKGAITHIDFSPRDVFCAYSDAAFTTTLLRNTVERNNTTWEYVGRIRAHYQPINDLRFWSIPGSPKIRLFTLGQDQIFTEYDLCNSKKDNIVIHKRFRIEQMSVPLCLGNLPRGYKEDYILVSTDASKLKLLNSSNFNYTKTVMTNPIGIKFHKILPLPCASDDTAKFLICMSNERIALVMLPMDGDPLKTTNVIAHPSGKLEVSNSTAMVLSYDGKYAFTAGGRDTCVHMWSLVPSILEKRVAEAGCVKRRYYNLLSSQMLDELKDFFYYTMLKTQGMNCLDTRYTTATIPVSEMSSVMRAIGYYPTEEEVSEMITEVKCSRDPEANVDTAEVDLDTFIQMYCNYRPCRGTLFRELEDAFEILCHVKDCDTGRSLYFRDPRLPRPCDIHIPPEFLINYLQTLGEPLSERELAEYMAILLGHIPLGGKLEATITVDASLAANVDASLPMFFNAKNFAQRMLGFRMCGKNLEDY